MCDKCKEIDIKISQYQRLARGIGDQKTVEAAAHLIADLEAQKVSLHPESEEK
jgi:hypothetical protein